MYIWNTSKLAEDIKNDCLSDEEWKKYYLAGSILITLGMYLSMSFPSVNIQTTLVEAIAVIGVIIFGVSTTFNTNQSGNGTGINYIARVTALSLPLIVKICLLSLAFGILSGIAIETLSLSMTTQNWSMTTFSILVQILMFWRLNVHLININT